MELTELCKSAIVMWERASGTSLQAAATSFNLDPNWNPKHVSRMLAQLQGVPHAAQLCVNVLSANYAALSQYLRDTGESRPEVLDAHQQLGKTLAEPAAQTFLSGAKTMIRELLLRFMPALSLSAEDYVSGLPLEVLLNADQSFAAMKKMQWSSGSAGLVLNYNNAIPLFSTVSQLTQAFSAMPEGFTLSCIQGETLADSYFVITLKSGANIRIFTDMPGYADPAMASRLASRNQRHNAGRIEKSYLPYDLLSLRWHDNDRHVTCEATLPEHVSAEGFRYRVLGFVGDLPLDSLLWLSRLAERCAEYLGEMPTMALLPDDITDHGAHPLPMLVTPGAASPIVTLPELTALDRDAFIAAFPQSAQQGGHRQWMEDAFAHDISNHTLYPTIATQHCLLAAPFAPSASTGRPLPERFSALKQPMALTLLPLPTQRLYTDLEAHHAAVYVGRHNLAAVVEGRVLQDFAMRRNEMQLWVYKKIVAHLPSLLPALLTLSHDTFSMYQHPGACRILDKTDLVRQVHWVACKHRWFSKSTEASQLIRLAKLIDGHEACCYVQKHLHGKKVRSNHRLILQLNNIFDLMNVTGLQRDEFPPCLRDYGLPRHLGNTLLSTVDPVDLMFDPWNSLVFTFALPVSKSAVNQYRKAQGLAPMPEPKNFPHYWESTPAADKLYDSLRQAGHRPVKLSHPPSCMYHESTEQRQPDMDALNARRRFAGDVPRQFGGGLGALPTIDAVKSAVVSSTER